MSTYRILVGDCRDSLASLPDGCVQTCVTSPPYWGLRDYGHDGQLGLEQTPEEYVARMVEVFREVRRVLRDDGTLWLNLGDSYAAQRGGTHMSAETLAGGSGGKTEDGSRVNRGRHDGYNPTRNASAIGLKHKDLIGIPWRVAFALQQPYEHVQIRQHVDRAWLAALVDGEGTITILRTTSPHGSGDSYPPILQVRMCDAEPIVKAAEITGYGKASPKQDPPSTGGNRGSYCWRLNGRKAADIIAEIYPYLLVKRRQAVVAWNHQLIRDSYETKRGVTIPADALAKQRQCRDLIRALNAREDVDLPSWMQEPRIVVEPGWYLRSDCIWSKPNPMPESVTDRPTKAHEYLFLLSKSERYYYDADAIAEPSVIGEGAVRNITPRNKGQASTRNDGDRFGIVNDGTRNARTVWTISTQPYKGAHFATFPPELAERCIKAGSKPGDVVLDPFAGSGTTGMVATGHGRRAILCELNPAYADLIRERCGPMLEAA